MRARLIFADGAFVLLQEEASFFATVAHSMHKMHAIEHSERDTLTAPQDECEIRIPCEICASVSSLAHILDEYRVLTVAERINLNRVIDPLERYLEGVYSYTKEIKEMIVDLSIEDCNDLDSALFLHLQRKPDLCEAMRYSTYDQYYATPPVRIARIMCF